MTDRTCSVDGCEGQVRCRGWCVKHYARWHKTGSPTTPPRRIFNDDAARWWSYVDKTDTCWLWIGEQKPNGYGVIRIKERNVYAHRFGYELNVGPIPAGMQLDHLCRVRNCVNPAHLEPVAQRENILRGEGLSAKRAAQTHCKRGHEFTPENTYRAPSAPNSRTCRTCIREQRRSR